MRPASYDPTARVLLSLIKRDKRQKFRPLPGMENKRELAD
jgi:hypothetical protein